MQANSTVTGTVGTSPNTGSIASVGGTTGATGPRDLSGGLSVERLTGTWTVASGPAQCRLNLTFTAKSGTRRYRASTPACDISTLATVASWTVTGSQVQLFDERGEMVAALVQTGNRFVGTSAGGAAISMTE